MKTVWKFPTSPNPFSLGLPVGAQVIHFDMQRGKPTMWVLVDNSTSTVSRHFLVAGTGYDLPDNVRHVSSCIDRELGLVWHLFEPLSEDNCCHELEGCREFVQEAGRP